MDTMYRPVSSMSAAERITFVHYEVSVPRLYLQSADAANFYGTVTQDNQLAQKEQEQGDMRVNLPITKMAELFAKGCRPWFLRVSDTVMIYRAVAEYLRVAAENFDKGTTGGRFNDTMLDNLLKLENFAQWVFDVALEHFPKERLEPLGTLAAYSRRAPMSRIPKEQVIQQQEAAAQREHVRVVDELVERQVARQRSGWH